MESFFLVQDYQLAVLVGLLQHVLTLLDVTVIVLQAQQGGYQGYICLQRKQGIPWKQLSGEPAPSPFLSPRLPQAEGAKLKQEKALKPLLGCSKGL